MKYLMILVCALTLSSFAQAADDVYVYMNGINTVASQLISPASSTPYTTIISGNVTSGHNITRNTALPAGFKNIYLPSTNVGPSAQVAQCLAQAQALMLSTVPRISIYISGKGQINVNRDYEFLSVASCMIQKAY
jgi:hypothetical protein